MTDIEAIKARLEHATPGPWQTKHLLLHPGEVVAVGDNDGWHIADCQTTGRTLEEVAANATFIAHAPTDIASLLAALTAERARADQRECDLAIVHHDHRRILALLTALEQEHAALICEADALRVDLEATKAHELEQRQLVSWAVEVVENTQAYPQGGCECQPCPQCGEMPAVCSTTACADTCECGECDGCRIIAFLDAAARDGANPGAAAVEAAALRAEAKRLTSHLRILGSCVDNIECDCLDPPEDRDEDPDDPGSHSQYCRVYLRSYIAAVLRGEEPPA